MQAVHDASHMHIERTTLRLSGQHAYPVKACTNLELTLFPCAKPFGQTAVQFGHSMTVYMTRHVGQYGLARQRMWHSAAGGAAGGVVPAGPAGSGSALAGLHPAGLPGGGAAGSREPGGQTAG